jgi:serine protease Do/serine protease DegQ
VKALVAEVSKFGRLRPKLVDFRVQNVNARVARILGSELTKGAVVAEIQKNGPAYKAGLRVGDIITNVNGHPVENAEDVFANIWAQPVGTTVRCQIERGGKKLMVEFTVSDAQE